MGRGSRSLALDTWSLDANQTSSWRHLGGRPARRSGKRSGLRYNLGVTSKHVNVNPGDQVRSPRSRVYLGAQDAGESAKAERR